MQHVLQNVPNFSALPQQQQLQKLHMVYQVRSFRVRACLFVLTFH